MGATVSASKFVTQVEFARLRGYAASYVAKLMRAGRLVMDSEAKRAGHANLNMA